MHSNDTWELRKGQTVWLLAFGYWRRGLVYKLHRTRATVAFKTLSGIRYTRRSIQELIREDLEYRTMDDNHAPVAWSELRMDRPTAVAWEPTMAEAMAGELDR